MARTDANPPMPDWSDEYELVEVDADYLAKAVKPKQFIHIDQSECIMGQYLPIVLLMLLAVAFGAMIAGWSLWQNRGKAKPAAIETSTYGRPLVKAR